MVDRAFYGADEDGKITSLRGLNAYMVGYNYGDRPKRLYFEWDYAGSTAILAIYLSGMQQYTSRAVIIYHATYREMYNKEYEKIYWHWHHAIKEGHRVEKFMDVCRKINWYPKLGTITPIPDLNKYVGHPDEGKQLHEYMLITAVLR